MHTAGFTDPEAAAGFFKGLGFQVEWKEADTLVATHVAPAVVPHPVTGQPVWFNLTHLAGPGWTEYGDGSPIEPGGLWWAGWQGGVHAAAAAQIATSCAAGVVAGLPLPTCCVTLANGMSGISL